MKENFKIMLAVLVLILKVNIIHGQKQKPVFDEVHRLHCVCGAIISKTDIERDNHGKPIFYSKENGYNSFAQGNYVFLYICPKCGKHWRYLAATETIVPIPYTHPKKKHISSNECFSGVESKTGNIKSVKITNNCPFHETIYIILRGKSIKDEVYLIEWGKTWINNVDLDKYYSKIEIYHKEEVPDGMIEVKNDSP